MSECTDRNCLTGVEKCDLCAERDFAEALDIGNVCRCGHLRNQHVRAIPSTCWASSRCPCPTFTMAETADEVTA